MKRLAVIGVSMVLLAAIGTLCTTKLPGAEAGGTTRYEYATLRWAGRDNTHVIRPNRDVEILGKQLRKINKPERTDERSFYMNIAVNELAKEGYALVAITPDDYLFRRKVTP
jgi:hypothetical protein